METIIYQGREIQATRVNYLSGNIPTCTVDNDGDEDLFLDEQGRYYLRRKLNLLDSESLYPREASGRTLIHRVNVSAAILWATTRLNSETLDLRYDAAALLMEGRGYLDPNPVHLNATKRNALATAAGQPVCAVDGPVSGLTADGWFDGCIQPEEGSGARARTIFDLDPLHAALLKLFTERHGINVAVLVRATLLQQLEFMYDGRDSEEEEAAVDALREHGRLGPPSASEEVEQMRAALGMTQRSKIVPLPELQEARGEPEPPESDESPARFTFDYPATERYCGMRRTVELTAEQMKRARELAAIFGLDVSAFLRGLVHNNTLPGQPRADRPDTKLKSLLKAEHIEFVCTDDALTERIARAAQACGQSVEEFVADALAGDVDMYEENMLLHPMTGDLLDTDFEDLYWTVEAKMTVPPMGREDEPQFRNSMGKERVNFGVYLRPDQLERLEYPHFVTDCETGAEYAFALIPLDPEGSPHLSVGKLELKPGESLPQIKSLPSPQQRGERKGAA